VNSKLEFIFSFSLFLFSFLLFLGLNKLSKYQKNQPNIFLNHNIIQIKTFSIVFVILFFSISFFIRVAVVLADLIVVEVIIDLEFFDDI
jgi:hypothetical protein